MYSGHQPYAKYFLDVEISRNPGFVAFLEQRERMPESRKLPIQSFINRPTARLARYPLLLEAIVKASKDHYPDDTVKINAAIVIIKEFLQKINQETGKADNRIRLTQLNDGLVGKQADVQALDLLNPARHLIREGNLKKKQEAEQFDFTVFLFDHMLLITKKKKIGEMVEYRIYKRPIPLEMLAFAMTEDPFLKPAARKTSNAKPPNSPLLSPNNSTSSSSAPMTPKYQQPDLKQQSYPLTITHLGRGNVTHVLYAQNQAERKQWKDKIEQQRELLTESRKIFDKVMLTDTTFPKTNRVNCTAVYDKHRIVYGTDDGVYVAGQGAMIQRVLEMEKVLKIEILEEFNLILVLAGTLYVVD
jgi:hypothetical protein